MKIPILKTFSQDYISRQAGERLRKMILPALQKDEPLQLDFTGLIVGSVSFFDEGIAKLISFDIQEEKFRQLVQLIDMHPKDYQLLQSLCQKRSWQI